MNSLDLAVVLWLVVTEILADSMTHYMVACMSTLVDFNHTIGEQE